MTQQILVTSWPWALLLVGAVIVARLLIGIAGNGAQLKWAKIRAFRKDQRGTVQSLSFVLTVPFFILVMMLIVQVSQIMIANIVVHYSAFAAARSASVWIPANVTLQESQNRISSIELIQSTSEGWQYRIAPFGPKYEKARQAAVLAIMPLGPSRNMNYSMDTNGEMTLAALERMYAGLDAESVQNSRIPFRLRNKLAYSYANTDLDLTFWHRRGPFPDYQDPPLQVRYEIRPWADEYYDNEIGWQDHLTATVSYNLPLIPGPVRLFAPAAQVNGAPRRDQSGETYVWSISASATMINEGEKPVLAYWQEFVSQ